MCGTFRKVRVTQFKGSRMTTSSCSSLTTVTLTRQGEPLQTLPQSERKTSTTLTTATISTTFNVDDWIKHTPKHILAKNFGLPESVFADVPSPNPYIQQGNISDSEVTGGAGELSGDASFVYYAKDHALQDIPGGGGTLRIIDTTTFPASETIAATVVTLVPGGLRELHWHPNVSQTCRKGRRLKSSGCVWC